MKFLRDLSFFLCSGTEIFGLLHWMVPPLSSRKGKRGSIHGRSHKVWQAGFKPGSSLHTHFHTHHIDQNSVMWPHPNCQQSWEIMFLCAQEETKRFAEHIVLSLPQEAKQIIVKIARQD